MPNPDRPQYQDTIEETWGQAVADTVVRRYATTADRDADLGAFPPAELAGQVVVIVPGAGATPYLQIHNGVAWYTPGAYGARCYMSDFQLPDYTAPARLPMTKDFDPFGCVRPVTGGSSPNTYFAPATGLYFCDAQWGGDIGGGNSLSVVQFRVNGAGGAGIRSHLAHVFIGKGAGWRECVRISDLVSLNAGDEIAPFAGCMGLPWLGAPNTKQNNYFSVHLAQAG
jgi:hypothetical protein